MPLPIALQRMGFRTAYALLRVYWLVRRPSSHGVKCVLTDGDRVLLVRHTYGPREWELPGGNIKRNEPPLKAARREMREELGICIEEWRSLGELFARLHHRRDTLHCFQAELREPGLEINQGELAAANWFARDELPAAVGRYVRPILARTG